MEQYVAVFIAQNKSSNRNDTSYFQIWKKGKKQVLLVTGHFSTEYVILSKKRDFVHCIMASFNNFSTEHCHPKISWSNCCWTINGHHQLLTPIQ